MAIPNISAGDAAVCTRLVSVISWFLDQTLFCCSSGEWALNATLFPVSDVSLRMRPGYQTLRIVFASGCVIPRDNSSGRHDPRSSETPTLHIHESPADGVGCGGFSTPLPGTAPEQNTSRGAEGCRRRDHMMMVMMGNFTSHDFSLSCPSRHFNRGVWSLPRRLWFARVY